MKLRYSVNSEVNPNLPLRRVWALHQRWRWLVKMPRTSRKLLNLQKPQRCTKLHQPKKPEHKPTPRRRKHQQEVRNPKPQEKGPSQPPRPKMLALWRNPCPKFMSIYNGAMLQVSTWRPQNGQSRSTVSNTHIIWMRQPVMILTPRWLSVTYSNMASWKTCHPSLKKWWPESTTETYKLSWTLEVHCLSSHWKLTSHCKPL